MLGKVPFSYVCISFRNVSVNLKLKSLLETFILMFSCFQVSSQYNVRLRKLCFPTLVDIVSFPCLKHLLEGSFYVMLKEYTSLEMMRSQRLCHNYVKPFQKKKSSAVLLKTQESESGKKYSFPFSVFRHVFRNLQQQIY